MPGVVTDHPLAEQQQQQQPPPQHHSSSSVDCNGLRYAVPYEKKILTYLKGRYVGKTLVVRACWGVLRAVRFCHLSGRSRCSDTACHCVRAVELRQETLGEMHRRHCGRQPLEESVAHWRGEILAGRVELRTKKKAFGDPWEFAPADPDTIITKGCAVRPGPCSPDS